MSRAALLVIGHGSRDPRANAEFEALVGRLRVERPGMALRHGYIELAEPLFQEPLRELARGADQVVVLPLFLFAAGHVKDDVARAIAEARRELPGVRFAASRALGVHPYMVELALERIRPQLDERGKAPPGTALVVVGRGSSDPDANGDFCKVARLLSEGRDFEGVVPTFIGITRPLLGESLELAVRSRPRRLVVHPYFLFAGELTGRIEAQVAAFRERHPELEIELTPPLGLHPRLFDLIDERVTEALSGEACLPCDNCRYRTPVAGARLESRPS